MASHQASPSSFPLWDSTNPDQQEIVGTSTRYKDLLKHKLDDLTALVRLPDIWPTLTALSVIDQPGKDKMLHNATPAEAVGRLLHHLEREPTWKLHGFVRALAKTDQHQIIHDLGLKPGDYEDPPTLRQHPPSDSHLQSDPKGHPKGQKPHYYRRAEDDAMIQISNDLLPGVLEHCGHYNRTLMRASLFCSWDDYIDLKRIYIHRNASCWINTREKLPVGKKELFQRLFEARCPNCLSLEGPDGVGKSSYLEEFAYDWSQDLTGCEQRGPDVPCEGHLWKLVVYIFAGGIRGSAVDAIRDNLSCRPPLADQMMHDVEEDGEGVLIIYDDINQLHNKYSIDSISSYTETAQKMVGKPKVLVAARDGLLSVEQRYFDRKLHLEGFSLSQGIAYMRGYFKEMRSLSDHPMLDYVEAHPQDLEWVITKPLIIHVFSELTAHEHLTLQDVKMTKVKVFKILEEILLWRDKECRPTQSGQPTNFYQACLKCLLTHERILSQEDVGTDSPYLSLLQKHSNMDMYANQSCYFSFGHEMLFEYFSMRGLIECLMNDVEYKKGMLLWLCSNAKMRNVIRLTCGYIAQHEPHLLHDVVFIIRACLILQPQHVWCEQNELTEALLQLPAVIQESFSPNVLTHGLTGEQATNLGEISNQIQVMFSEKADHLKEAGWFLNEYNINANGDPQLDVSPFQVFLLGCLQQLTPQQLEDVCSQTITLLLPCCRYNMPTTEGHCNVSVVPVSGIRWAAITEKTQPSSLDINVNLSSPCDLSSTLNTWSHMQGTHRLLQQHKEEQHQVQYTVVIDRTAHTLCTSLPADPWSEDQWTPGLRELLSPSYCTGGITVHMGYSTPHPPLSGLLSACRKLITPGHGLTGGLQILHGQVPEEELTVFCSWAGEVGLELDLYYLTVVLRAGRGEEDWKDVDSAIRRTMEIDVHEKRGKLHEPIYMTSEGEVFSENYDGTGTREDSESEKEHRVEKPIELQALVPKYQAAYEEACKKGTETVYQSRVMVVGHYGAGKTNLIRCILEKDFVKEYKPTIGIDADPSDGKIDITQTMNWKTHKDDTYDSKVAKHLVAEVQKQQKPLLAEALQGKTQAVVRTKANAVRQVGKDQQSMVTEEESPETSQEDPLETRQAITYKEREDESKKTAGSYQMEKAKLKGIPKEILKGIRTEERKARKTKDVEQSKLRQLYFWDFAGQGVFYTTHQIFLTARSLYFVVMNLKKKLTDTIPTCRINLEGKRIPDHSCPQTVQEYLEYWLSSIHTHVQSSKRAAWIEDTGSGPQVIIALTYKDECSEDEVKEYTDCINKLLEEKGYGFLVEQVTAISNLERNPDDTNQLRGTLERLVGDRGYKVPLSWYKLKEAIMQDERKSLTLQEVHQIAKKADLTELDDIGVKAALSLFHETGDVVYFGDGPLADFIVTDTQWLIDQFKKVITIDHEDSPKYSENPKYWADLDGNGILHQKLLESLWPKDTGQNLLDTMLKFALLMPAPDFYEKYKIDEEDKLYLVPCLLPSGKHLDKLETDKVIRLCPNAGFLPVGLVSRLISSLCNSREPKWEVCGQVYHDSAKFKTSPDMEVTICIRHQTDKNSNDMKVIEVMVSTGAGEKKENKLKERLSTIAQSLQHLPGRNDFDVWLFCSSCQRWNVMCDLNGIEDRSICNRGICDKHGVIVKQSEHALWFCERREEETDTDPNKHQRKCEAAEEYSAISKLDRADNFLEDKYRQDLASVLLLVFIRDINEEQLVKMGFPADRWKAALLIISEIRGSPRWRIKGFCRAFHLGIQNLIKQVHRLQKLTFSRSFDEEGGVLDNPETDVVLTVPLGAIPPGKGVDICMTIHTDLETYREVIYGEESILGPVVECEMDRKMTFHKAVTLSIPLCTTTKRSSDITVLYSDGDIFKDISTNKSMSYRIKGNILEVETQHFTEFVVKGEIVIIGNILLTLGARLQHGSKCSELELRPMAHVNCLALKEFEGHRVESVHESFKEIDRELVSLPEGEEPLQLPEILVKVWVKEGSPWKILDYEKGDAESCSLEKRKRGMDILYTKDWSSRPLPKFLLESAGTVKQAECRMNITFKYKEDGIDPVVHTISVIYPPNPTPSGSLKWPSSELEDPEEAKRPRVVGANGSQVPTGIEARAPTLADSMKKELTSRRDDLVGTTGWGVHAARPHFQAWIATLKILQDTDIQDLKAAKTPTEASATLIDYLLACNQASLVRFAWLLVDVSQDHQLPESITPDRKSWLQGYNKKQIMTLNETE